jgi:hypothetical protein
MQEPSMWRNSSFNMCKNIQRVEDKLNLQVWWKMESTVKPSKDKVLMHGHLYLNHITKLENTENYSVVSQHFGFWNRLTLKYLSSCFYLPHARSLLWLYLTYKIMLESFRLQSKVISWVWWHMPVIPAAQRLRKRMASSRPTKATWHEPISKAKMHLVSLVCNSKFCFLHNVNAFVLV